MSRKQEALEEINELHREDIQGRLVSRAADLTADFLLHALAETLGATTWSPCDGTETWDGDVLGTMQAILTNGGVFDAETDESAMDRAARVEAKCDALAAENAVLRAAAVALDVALSNLWREGPVQAGHHNHLGPVDEAWQQLRAALKGNTP